MLQRCGTSMGVCTVCDKTSELTCARCCKIFYCSAGHLVEDKERHRADCFPAILKYDMRSGKFYHEASRAILQGELIFNECSVLSAPSPFSAGDGFKKICLGCYQVVDGSYKCSKCRWYLCSQDCELVALHAGLECEIFSTGVVLPSLFTHPMEYQLILLLRYLLLRDEPKLRDTWDVITRLKTYSAKITGPSHWKFATQAVVFIQDRCGLRQFDSELIKDSLRLLKINSLDEGAFRMLKGDSIRYAAHIFPKTSFMTHNCSPNTYWSISTGEMVDALEGVKYVRSQIQVRASVLIRAGEVVTRNYVDIFYDTSRRRQSLQWCTYETCFCPRCRDPTELGTGMNAIKCRSCQYGYFLPAQDYSTWVCAYGFNSCGREIVGTVAQHIVVKIAEEIHSILAYAKSEINFLKVLTRYNRFLKAHSGFTVHENHWTLSRVRYQLVEAYLSRFINQYHYNPNGANHEILFVVAMYKYSQQLLEITHSLYPGHNLIRGLLLYYQVQALVCLICKAWHHQDYVMLKVHLGFHNRLVLEGRKILLQEPTTSHEYRLGTTLGSNKYIQKIARAMEGHFRSVLASASASPKAAAGQIGTSAPAPRFPRPKPKRFATIIEVDEDMTDTTTTTDGAEEDS